MPVPYTFGSATASIPLSQLDSNFATAITIGNTAVQLGNTVTTLNNMTLANVTISSGNVTITNVTVTTANATTANVGTLVVTSNATVGGNISVTGNVSMNVATITTSNVTTENVSSLIVTGNQTFVGTGNRITGDFSNATVANRVMFQTSTTNSSSVVGVLPNGTGTITQFAAYGGSDPANAQVFRFDNRGGSESRIESTYAGTPTSGTYLPMTFYTGGSERMRVDTSGNVGIGISTVETHLQVYGAGTTNTYWANGDAAGATLYLRDSGSSANNGGQLLFGAGQGSFGGIKGVLTNGTGPSGDLVFQTRTTSGNIVERMRIDSSGNVGIGTTSPSFPLTVVTSSSALGIAINGRSSDNFGSLYFYANNASTQHATITASATEFRLSSVPAAAVQTFYTNGSERMRIDSSGNLFVGATSGFGGNKFYVTGVASATNSSGVMGIQSSTTGDTSYPVAFFCKFDSNSTTSQVFLRFAMNNNGTSSGQINANGANAAAFGSWSDKRLKQNIVDLPSQLANIMALRPVEFDYIESEGGGHQIGFIAQEVKEIYPDLVGERDDGMLTLSDMNKNDARLIKAIQEQQALIQQLQADIATLKGQK